MSRSAEEDLLHFHSKVDRSGGEQACWPWLGARTGRGYGHVQWTFNDVRRMFGAHVVAFSIANGTGASGRTKGSWLVRHHCDNPICCNPSHLESGSHGDNLQDAITRGRAKRTPMHGDANHRAILTWAQVEDIRSRPLGYGTGRKLASEFGVSPAIISQIRTGRTWTTLPPSRKETS